MSQPAVGQSQRNEPIGGDSRTTPNGIESTNFDETADIDPPHFGIFHDQVEREVQRFHDGLDTLGDAVAELTKIFRRHGKIVKAVSKRWGKDQALEEEIHTLKVAKAEVWRQVNEDREKHNTEMSNLKRAHADEVAMLNAQANAGKQEKVKYEEMERRLEAQHNKAMQNMDRELKQGKILLEQENAEKIATLGREKRELEDAKAKLEQELKERTKELNQEKETRIIMQDKKGKDIRGLQKTLSDINAPYQMDKKPLQF